MRHPPAVVPTTLCTLPCQHMHTPAHPQATNMARHMVAECGMSPAIGPVFVPAGDERHGGASEATRRAVDGEVAAMLVGAKEQVKRLLASNMQVGVS